MLTVENISRKFRNFSLENISFSVDDGEYYILLGPSGSGKTILLEILAGLTRADKGKILVDDIDISRVKIQKRPFGIVFQDYSIFPHLTVWKNIAYSLHYLRLTTREIQKRIMSIAEKLELTEHLDRMPTGLSGGELQRVAMARTLVRRPRFLLLDEPLASLDIRLRHDLRRLLKNLNSAGQTIIHVTHDYEEAILLADMVGVIHQGRMIQTGTATDVFRHPKSEFVARFTGIRNYFRIVLKNEDGKQFGYLENKVKFRMVVERDEGNGYALISSEDILVSNARLESSATNNFMGSIKEINPVPYGFELLIEAEVPLYVRITRESFENLGLGEGKLVWASFKANSIRFVSD
jgi:ABC-type Fe3+/spermidine/putrescine transport system ATPase subunit